MKHVTQYYCAECGVIADEYFAQDDCPQCHSNTWIFEELKCSCLEIGPTIMYQDVLIVTDPWCLVHGYR